MVNADVLPNIDDFRKVAIDSDILTTLIDLLEFDKQGLSDGPRTSLMKLADYGSYLKSLKKTLLADNLFCYSADVRNELARGSHITKIVAFSRDNAVEKSNEATKELTTLSKHGASCLIFAP